MNIQMNLLHHLYNGGKDMLCGCKYIQIILVSKLYGYRYIKDRNITRVCSINN